MKRINACIPIAGTIDVEFYVADDFDSEDRATVYQAAIKEAERMMASERGEPEWDFYLELFDGRAAKLTLGTLTYEVEDLEPPEEEESDRD